MKVAGRVLTEAAEDYIEAHDELFARVEAFNLDNKLQYLRVSVTKGSINVASDLILRLVEVLLGGGEINQADGLYVVAQAVAALSVSLAGREINEADADGVRA